LPHNVFGHVARNGHAHALKTAATALDGGVDADYLAFEIDERTALLPG